MSSDNRQTVKLTQADLQRCQRLIEAVRQQLDAADVEIFANDNTWEIVWNHNGRELLAIGNTLAEAFDAAKSKMARELKAEVIR